MRLRYELFGWDYEQLSPLTDKEVAWYLGHARNTGGPVLELACGTGRLVEAMAQEGFDVEGLDTSERMLNYARERIGGLPSEVASRIQLHNLDMADFQLGRQFGLIVMADNSFTELDTRERQVSCLERVRQHLRPEGRFLVTVRRFDLPAYSRGKIQSGWSEPIRDPETQGLVSRKVTFEVLENAKRLRKVYYYKTTRRDGSETTQEFVSETPVMRKEDYLSRLVQTGFRVEVFVGYEMRMDDGENPILCLVCRNGAAGN